MPTSILKNLKSISDRTDKWLKKARSYMYNFRDGHFQFPYAANDPELMIEGLKKTPFVTYNADYQCLETNSPFLKVKQNYVNIEDGLWLICTHLQWKVKVKVIALIDDEPSDYYFLTFSRTTNSINVCLKDGNQEYSSNNHSWTLYKSTTALDAYFEKNCKLYSIFFVFNKKWLLENIFGAEGVNIDIVNNLLQDDYAYKSYLFNNKEISDKCTQIFKLIDNVTMIDLDLENLKAVVLNTITDFFKNTSKQLKAQTHKENIKNIDRNKIEKVEKLLSETLTTGFWGIENLATEHKISPTKLKNDFKNVFGKSIFQYYQIKQMELSVEMLKKQIPIYEIAKSLNYENQSKFSAKFKNTYGILPSKYF